MLHLFYKHTPTTKIYTLSLHDALPIYHRLKANGFADIDSFNRPRTWAFVFKKSDAALTPVSRFTEGLFDRITLSVDRKSTRLNSSHSQISYAVLCLKKQQTSASDDGDR